MAVKVRVGNSRGAKRPLGLWLRIVRAGFLLLVACTLVGGAVFAYYYFQYQKVVDDRLAAGPMFASVAQIYGAPREVRTGQKLDVELIAQDLRQAGYNANPRLGTFSVNGDSISIHPGPESYHAPDGATIAVAGGEVQSITADNGASLRSYRLEPKLITGLSEDKNRIKRRLVTYDDIPKVLVDAVLAIEDRRFFEHSGLNYGRLAECAVEDIEAQKMSCGGSTITQQLARGFFLSRDKKISRKLEEILITFQLEARFNKQQIFEMYANEINLGQRGSYGINGFGEASQAFLGKNIRQLTLADAALLAGLIQNPNRRNPYRHPDRATERRNVVLDSMVETGAITASEAEHAKAQPLRLAPPNVDASEAPYFVDLVHDQLVQRIGDQDLGRQNLRIYTSLDPELQRAASEAVDIGMRNVDEMVRKGNHGTALPQVALIALDPHTGQVLALVGGRNYGISQLNHAVAKRPTGSIFKPFVYAAAYVQSLDGRSLSGQPVASLDGSDDPDAPPSPGSTGVFTALTKLNDVQTTFTFDNGRQSYTPRDFKSEYHGEVTATYALAHSLNNATISLGQEVGFENVAALARASGITAARGTPAVALGSYDATPLDMAGAYTVFANNGVHLNPWMLASVRNDAGDVVADFAPEAKQVMDVRAAYLTTNMLEGVMNFGYGIAARQHGFTAPAAGKTGTSHDAWFAGYSSNLICIVWIGNDDYTDVKLQGALAAAPIWAEFMKRAIKLPQYSDMQEFAVPDGVQVMRIDKATNMPVDSTCEGNSFTAAFLAGTAPQGTCSHMGQDIQSLTNQLYGSGYGSSNPQPQPMPGPPPPESDGQPGQPKKPNFFKKMFGGGKDKQTQQPPDEPQRH
jgi:penicillin-binding protein 1B